MRTIATNQILGVGPKPWRLLLLLGLVAAWLVLTSPSPAAAVGAVGTSPDAGHASSLELDAAGNPVVSYITGGVLKLLHCDDPDCTGGGESIAAVAADVRLSTSLALDGSGNPVIAYHGGSPDKLIVTHCNDVNCNGGDESTVSFDFTGVINCCISLVLDAAGNPVVAYHAKPTPLLALRVLHCGNPNCTAGNSLEFPDTTSVAQNVSMVLDASGNPVISYTSFGGIEGLKLLHCNDPDCSGSDESVVVLDPNEDLTWTTSLQLDAAGNPVISYYDGSLRVVHCNDPNCGGGDDSIQAPDTDPNVGGFSSLALDAAGNPAISYQDLTNGDLRVMRCNDANCAGDDENIQTADEFEDSGISTSLELDGAGNPVISYCQGSDVFIVNCNTLKILHCVDAKCAAEPVGGVAELAPVDTAPLDAAGSRGSSAAVVIAAVALVAAAVALGGVGVWRAKRR